MKQTKGQSSDTGVRSLKRNIIQLISEHSISPIPSLPPAYKKNEKDLQKIYKSLKKIVRKQTGGEPQCNIQLCNTLQLQSVPNIYVIFKNRSGEVIQRIKSGYRPCLSSYPTITYGETPWRYVYIQTQRPQNVFSDHITMKGNIFDHLTLYDFESNGAHKLYLKCFNLDLCTTQPIDVAICIDIIIQNTSNLNSIYYSNDITILQNNIITTLQPLMNTQRGGKATNDPNNQQPIKDKAISNKKQNNSYNTKMQEYKDMLDKFNESTHLYEYIEYYNEINVPNDIQDDKIYIITVDPDNTYKILDQSAS